MSHSVTQIPYDERFSEASAKASTHWNNAIFENHYMLGDLEEEYGLGEGALDIYRIDR
mgnify:FL=1